MNGEKVTQLSGGVKAAWKTGHDAGAVVVYVALLAVALPYHLIGRGLDAAVRRVRSRRVRRGVLLDLQTRRLRFDTVKLLADAGSQGPWVSAPAALTEILERLVAERFPNGLYSDTPTNSVLLDALVSDALQAMPEGVVCWERSALLRRNL